MGEKCCVPGCKSNYELKRGVPVGADERVPIFSFPKDSRPTASCMAESNPKKGLNPTKNSGVCEKHFQPEHILKNSPFGQGKVRHFML